MRYFIVVLFSGFLLTANPVHAQMRIAAPDVDLKESGTVSSQLRQVERSGFAKGGGELGDLLQIADGHVAIVAVPVGRNRDALEADLRGLGMRDVAAAANMISGWFPIDSITALGNLPSLRYARPSYRPITNRGRVTSQGSPAMNADLARDEWAVDGSGIRIGVISDSYDVKAGAARNVIDDDLPSDIRILRDLTRYESMVITGSDEGRAMMQLIHDIAPGAALSFYSGFIGEANMAEGILELARDGADVIVDDVGHSTSPFFQHGVIAQAVAKVVAEGVSYFSAAGNNAISSYESVFRPGAELVIGDDVAYVPHDFDPGPGMDPFMDIELEKAEGIQLSFQWDEPFASLGGEGPKSDLDLFLIDENDSLVAWAAATNTADPVEHLTFRTDSARVLRLLIGKRPGADPRMIKFIDFLGTAEYEYDLEGSTVFGHPNHEKAMAVGAAYYQNSPAFGVDPPVVENFSSAGGGYILFDENGHRLATPFATRKPNVVGPDGTNTTFFGKDSDNDGFPNFFGTSAAAPHVAAVAALMLEGAGGPGSLTPEEIYQALEEESIDMDDPRTEGFDAGFDNLTGHGYVQADRAIAATYNHSPLTEDDSASVSPGMLVRIDVLENDSDPEGRDLTIMSTSNGDRGVSQISGDRRSLLYQSPQEEVTDTLGYVVSDGWKESAATVIVHVVARANRPPESTLPVQLTFLEDSSLTVPLEKLVRDDSDSVADLVIQFHSDGEIAHSISDDELTLRSLKPDWWGMEWLRMVPRDTGGLTSLDSVQVTVVPVNDAPTANFFVTEIATVESGLRVNFADASDDARDPEGEVVGWLWTFGDGSTSTDQHPTHVFKTIEEVAVELVVTDNGGLSDRIVQAIVPTSLPRAEMPDKFSLHQNFPNPFNPTTTIRYELPVASQVTLTVLDLLGREIKTLVEGEQMTGTYEIRFDAGYLPSGLYLYRLEAGDHSWTKTMSLVK